MSDRALRRRYADVPALTFPDPAFAEPELLAASRVALITTAALRSDGVGRWIETPTGYTVLPGDVGRDVRLTHYSSNFDRVGFAVDHNVVFPIDRLRELAAQGTVGSVADRHIAFLGAQREAGLEAIRLDSGPAAAKTLRDDAVDVAVLTPVCPMCTRTACTLAHVLEAAGIATVVIASIRGQAESSRPPRALAVDFPLGRPLGRPADPLFQHRVLAAALDLLRRPTGPVLDDFPETVEAVAEPVACPLPPNHDPDVSPRVRELRGLRPAFDRSRRARHGRTNVGRVAAPDELEGVVMGFERVVEGHPLDAAGLPGSPCDAALDLRAYYEEAALALMEHVPDARSTDGWFTHGTVVGSLLRQAQSVLAARGHERSLWLHIVPMDRTDLPDV